jgi:hypothetical protein
MLTEQVSESELFERVSLLQNWKLNTSVCCTAREQDEAAGMNRVLAGTEVTMLLQ